LAAEWRRGAYRPLGLDEYIEAVCDIIEATPPGVVFHRLTGTAPPKILLAPDWCAWKWRVLNAIERELARRADRVAVLAPALDLARAPRPMPAQAGRVAAL